LGSFGIFIIKNNYLVVFKSLFYKYLMLLYNYKNGKGCKHMNTKVEKSDLFFLQDNRLSLAAKGLLMYLLVNPEERYANCENWLLDSNNTADEMETIFCELVRFDYILVKENHLKLSFLSEKYEEVKI